MAPRIFLAWLISALLPVAGLSVAVAVIASTPGTSGLSGTALSFDVGGTGECIEIRQGDEIEIALEITDVEQLMAWEATVSHEYDVIRILEHDLRIFLAQGDGGLIEASEPLPDNNGRHLLSIGGNAASVSGSGVLATIKFEAVGAGISTIDIPQNDLDDNGTTDEGTILTRNGGAKIDDLNGDNFFDGPVQSARIAVDASCVAPTEEPTDPPTPPPATSAATTPSPTSTLGPTVSGGPVNTTAPTATPPPGSAVWGDNNCSGEADPVDSLLTLRFDAGLSANTGSCPRMGAVVEVLGASPHLWGDVDCGGGVNPVDSLKLLRFDAGMSVQQETECPELGSAVTITE